MSVWLRNIGRWVGFGLVISIAAYIATEIVFYATGRGGDVPCGEDGWRWGLMFVFIWVPTLLAGLVVGASGFLAFRRRFKFWGLAGLVFLMQVGVAFAILAIFQWPAIIYRAPVCE